MSKLIVEVVELDEVMKHDNADKLELAVVRGWNCVVPKGVYKAGDKAVYIPIDAIIPFDLETKLLGNAKVRLNKGRIKTIKLRGAISQGLVASLESLGLDSNLAVGTDLCTELGITKYEPPTKGQNNLMGNAGKSTKKQINSHFRKYTSIENYKNYTKIFNEDDIVSVTEKVHGTSFRAGYVPFEATNLFKKILKFFRLAPKYEFVFGSHNVQLQGMINLNKSFYDTNVYAEAVKKYELRSILKEGEVVYGEIYGSGIQKNYDYGCKEGEHKLAIFDAMVGGEYIDASDLLLFCANKGLPKVGELYRGKFDIHVIKEILKGNSRMVPSQKVIEGGVIKPLTEVGTPYLGRKVLKLINDEYLLKDNTDFH